MSNVMPKKVNTKWLIFVIVALVVIGVGVFLVINSSNGTNVQQLEADLHEQELLATGLYASLLEKQISGDDPSSYIEKWDTLKTDIEEARNDKSNSNYGKKLQDLTERYKKLIDETKKYLGK